MSLWNYYYVWLSNIYLFKSPGVRIVIYTLLLGQIDKNNYGFIPHQMGTMYI